MLKYMNKLKNGKKQNTAQHFLKKKKFLCHIIIVGKVIILDSLKFV